MHLSPEACVSTLTSEGRALLEAASSDLTAAVPSCPGWDAARLLEHVSRVHRRVAGVIERRDLSVPVSELPAGVSLTDWYAQGLEALAGVLRGLDPGAPVPNWSPLPDTGAFWLRRMALETSVHRWDAQHAAGGPAPLIATVAADGIDELFTAIVPAKQSREPLRGLDDVLGLAATDLPGATWLRHIGPNSCEATEDPADAMLSGTASDLLLTLMGRPPAEAVGVEGDATLPARWRAAVRF
jgi:uncharacterized protein (TIGR03083 family)